MWKFDKLPIAATILLLHSADRVHNEDSDELLFLENDKMQIATTTDL